MKASPMIVVLTVLCVVPTLGRTQQVDSATAQKQFDKYCAKCHGSGGGGDGYLGPLLTQKPKDFTNCVEMAKESDDVLFNVIKNGGASLRGQRSDMPAMRRSLSDDEIRGLLARVREFCAGGGGFSVAHEHNSERNVQSP